MMMSFSFVFLIIFAVCSHSERVISQEEQRCIEMRDKYGIEPGKSFGSLPINMHKSYLAARCYRFFCQPNERAGKGVFDCEPLFH